MSTQVQNKPTAAYILALISGILGVLTALGIIVSGILTYTTFSEWTNYYNGYYYSDYYSSGLFGWSWTMLIGVGIWFLIASMLVIVFARKLNSNPLEHTKWGALILVFSIIGGGFLGLLGGILALIYKPTSYSSAPIYQQPYGAPQQNYAPPPTYAQPVQQPTNRVCPQCGRFINENTKFCPHCGRQLA